MRAKFINEVNRKLPSEEVARRQAKTDIHKDVYKEPGYLPNTAEEKDSEHWGKYPLPYDAEFDVEDSGELEIRNPEDVKTIGNMARSGYMRNDPEKFDPRLEEAMKKGDNIFDVIKFGPFSRMWVGEDGILGYEGEFLPWDLIFKMAEKYKIKQEHGQTANIQRD